MSDIYAELASADKAYIEAPAGCGKTYALAAAVSRCVRGRQLILTHTNAGVSAIRAHLRRHGVISHLYDVDTIAGWCQRLVESYPKITGYMRPPKVIWPTVYRKATELLDLQFMRRVIKSSYAGVFVDEYQDCTQSQHAVVCSLASLMPCRLLGDPLQAIFDFNREAGDLPVDWNTQVVSCFEQLPTLDTPWRWRTTNPGLGEWLLTIRAALARGQPIRIEGVPAYWRQLDTDKGANHCFNLLNSGGSIAVICSLEAQCHAFAKRTGGRYKSMETLECPALLSATEQISQSHGQDRVSALIAFVDSCTTHAARYMRDLVGVKLRTRSREYELRFELQSLIGAVADSDSMLPLLTLLRRVESIPGMQIVRPDLWEEMKSSLSLFMTGKFASLREAAIASRNQTRVLGRRPDYRTVSRTLLIKGLEFDHTVAIVETPWTKENLYVALTRASRTLTIISGSRTLIPKSSVTAREG